MNAHDFDVMRGKSNARPPGAGSENSRPCLQTRDNPGVKTKGSLVVAFLLLAQLGRCATQSPPATKAASQGEWPTALPEEVGLDSAALTELFDYVREHQTPIHRTGRGC